MQGTLTIKPKCASVNRNTDFLTKQDPYVRIKIGKQKWESSVHKKGGKKPSWEDSGCLQITPSDHIMEIELWDKDKLSDDLIAKGEYHLSKIFQQGHAQEWITLYYKGKDRGQIMIDLSVQQTGQQMGQGFNNNNYAANHKFNQPPQQFNKPPYQQNKNPQQQFNYPPGYNANNQGFNQGINAHNQGYNHQNGGYPQV